MRKLGETLRNLPHTRNLTIIAQDPSVKVGGKILTAEVQVPAEELMEGPRGFRVNVIDYDASTVTRRQISKPISRKSGR